MMNRLTRIILLLGLSYSAFSQSPHGADFKINCAACHSSTNWEIEIDTFLFNHDTTAFALNGQHQVIDCKDCHQTLKFQEASPSCISCHQDIHQTTLGADCARCHTSENWMVDNISQIHQDNGFPLLGVHEAISCNDCHTSESNLFFHRIGNDCINCHLDDFNQTTNPKHQDAGFSTNCIECHSLDGSDWSSEEAVNHDFFPLTKGHEIEDCNKCHSGGEYANTPTDCFACHQLDFENSENPNHSGANFSNNCIECHTTDVGWMPAEFADHDGLFPIYSGSHAGEWIECSDCHTDQSNYSLFTCVSCHTNPETDEEHTSVSGYSYENTACLACHPTGDTDNTFDHDDTAFPLTGAHLLVDCILCHSEGYEGTPTNCAACHTTDFEETTNPNHNTLGLSNDCVSCHTTEPEWSPAAFDNHDDYYVLNGAHAAIANDCVACHNGDYNNTPTDCFGCHEIDYNQSTNPNHAAAQFPTDCTSCHNENAWTPSSFNHDDHWVLDGAHAAVADDCIACHNGDYTNTPNTCVDCHESGHTQSINPNHIALNIGTDCASCHSTQPDWMPATFDIHDDYYPLNGAHALIANDCIDCHNGDYNNTPNDCFGCHEIDYNSTLDPNHQVLQLSTNCIDCHTESEWIPATFDHDGQYFPIYSGAHNGEWTECNECHTNPSNYAEYTCISCHTNPQTDDEHTGVNGYVYESTACFACHPTGDADDIFDHNTTNFPLTGAHVTVDCIDCHSSGYQGTPTDCVSCHNNDYDQTTNPNHGGLGLSTDCLTCHTTDPGWNPASFDNHNDFYALNGAHAAIANDCAACHNGDYNNTPNDCAGCHTDDFNASINPNHLAQQFPMDCASCHNEDSWSPSSFDHGNYFILDGAHADIADDCVACHNGDYTNTSNTCVGCHQEDHTQSLNPSHIDLSLSTDCESCHSTEPDWMPASFAIHDDFYPLNGAHAIIANDCVACHNGDYQNTPNDCIGCHADDYNNTTDPNHQTLQFSTDCVECHTESEWIPSTFDHDGQYFPIYSGAHEGEWTDCIDCHTNPSNYAEYTCISCHINPQTDDEHASVSGYIYENSACLACHPTGDADNIFDHNTTNFPLTGGHIGVDCIECHANGYQGTPTDCAFCHTDDFDQTTNPNHNDLGLSTDCASCHSTEPGWNPATFAVHDDYWLIDGAHTAVADDCAICHNGDYNNTPNTCAGCHTEDYNLSLNPSHTDLNLPTDCASCHSTEPDWLPATFDIHDDFYPLNGAHATIANDCSTCHNGNYNNTPNTCFGCHEDDYNNTTNPDHTVVQFPTDCSSCHNEDAWSPSSFNHDDYYVLDGAHADIAGDCNACHNGNYNNTPNTCQGCHIDDYNQSTNPNHSDLNLSTDCETCHTTDPGWSPASFDIHDDYYVLDGAHANVSNDCVACHNGNYNNTPTNCEGCHIDDYNQSTNPNHVDLAIPTDCETCHTTDPGWSPASFDIHDDYYVLDGAHAPIANDCATCHNGDYNNTPNTCDGCHIDDYNQTTNPNHVDLAIPTDCETCHTTDPGWVPATFNIHDDYYVLNGAHADIANDCAACHNGNYNNTPNTCDGCHMDDYNSTSNPNHAAIGLPIDCETCHTTDPGWMPATFGIHDDFWVIDGAHEDIANDCAACHNGNYNNTPNTCDGCHIDDYNASTNPNHISLVLPINCDMCHNTEPDWNPATFPIHDDFYPLNGAHATIADDCAACHNGNYNNTPNTCFGCHEDDYNNTSNPDHQAAQFSTDCLDCHTEDAWIPATFDHDQFYVLDGAHATIANDCALCHLNGNYSNTPNTCDGCHLDDYNQSTNPNHGVLGLPIDCESCHTTDPGWSPATFAIHDNYYVLDGAHAPIANDCAACHNGNYNNTPNTCDGCHMDDYNQSTNPNHVALALPIDCETCHTTDPGWMPASFPNHDDYYVLDGAHATIANDCALCHNGNYNNTPNTCDGCHIDDYNQSVNPDHGSLAIPVDCEMCHTTDPGWSPATFPIHDDYWVIDGAHTAVENDCAICHNGNYNNTPNTCDGCHLDDYNSTSNPNHGSIGIPVECDMCHTTDPGWIPATFPIHDNYWVIDGAHTTIADDCAACHNGNYNNTPNTCDGCHIDDYNQTTNPNHIQLNLPLECDMCHTTDPMWFPATFPIHDDFYPLVGAHATIANECVLCHNGNYNNTPNTCFGCHQDDYNMASNPNHLLAQLPTTCEDCHTEDAWIPSTFDHNVFYPLTGGHAVVANDCALCHVGGNYSNTPNTCDGCHMPDYNQSTNPNHVILAIPTDCEMCHTTDPDWMPATFPIHNNYYQLNGAHAAIANDCALCHNGNYNNTPNTCFGCHEDDYNGANNPNHVSAGFPTDCELCHNESVWVPSTFDHDGMYFPIYSGKHKDEWDACVDCHTIPGNFATFSCIDCHEHDDPLEVAYDHTGVSGYVYQSSACFACHPEGEE